MFKEFKNNLSPKDSYNKIIKKIQFGEFQVASTIPNEQIVLKGNRNYKSGILILFTMFGFLLFGIGFILTDVVDILLFLVGLIIAAIYYWTRPFKRIIINLEVNDSGSLITIMSDVGDFKMILFEIEKTLT